LLDKPNPGKRGSLLLTNEPNRARKWPIIFAEAVAEIDIEKWVLQWRPLEDYFDYPASAGF